MAILAIETATDACSIAVIDSDGSAVADATLHRPRMQASQLTPLIASLLERCGLQPRQIEVVAVSAGPGSYTGLRIGVSTAKGFALAIDADLVGVPTLHAFARTAQSHLAAGDLIVPSFDARRESVYLAAYGPGLDGLTEIVPSCAVSLDTVADLLPDEHETVRLIGSGAPLVRAALEAAGHRAVVEPDFRPSALTVAELGREMWLRDETSDLDTFEPHYLREFVANIPSRSAFAKLGF